MKPIRKFFQSIWPFHRRVNAPGIISKEMVARYLPDSPVIVEGGAHIGSDTEQLARMFPRGHIYSFEPVPGLYDRLVERTKPYPNVTCYRMALSNNAGETSMYVSGGASISSSSLRVPKEHLEFHPGVVFEEQITVTCVTLDGWAFQNGIANVDFIWLDVQGHEMSVLQSGLKILETVRAIYTEVNLKELYAGTPLYPEFRAWLEKQGFVMAAEALPWEDAGNVLFVRKKFLK